MKKIIVILIIVIFSHSSFAKDESPSISVESMPPSVIKTVPKAGQTDVDSSLSKIKVTFSKDMLTMENWSWVTVSKDSFPNITGNIKFTDRRTCVAPVKLEPNKTYAIWFNSVKFDHFKDIHKHAAVPYLLVFKTKKKE